MGHQGTGVGRYCTACTELKATGRTGGTDTPPSSTNLARGILGDPQWIKGLFKVQQHNKFYLGKVVNVHDLKKKHRLRL